MFEDIKEEALYEHDPWVIISKGLAACLKRKGFKAVREDGATIAWYHPKHWSAVSLFKDKKMKPDVWLFDHHFYAKTENARNWIKSED